MAKLDNKTALVAGGSGEVGEGIVRQFLEAGARVIVPGRSADKLQALRQRLKAADDRLTTITANVTDPTEAERVKAEVVAKFGGLDAVVASVGGWWQGQPITALSLEKWQSLIDQGLTTHFVLARTFLPLLAERPDTSYTLINGAGALQAIPGAGPIVVSTTAQLRLGEVLAAEAAQLGTGVRINNLVLMTPVITRSRSHGQAGWLSADDAGRYAVYLASDAGRAIVGQNLFFESADQLPID